MHYLMVEKRFSMASAMQPIVLSWEPSLGSDPYAQARLTGENCFGKEDSPLAMVTERVIIFRQTDEGYILPLMTWERNRPGGPKCPSGKPRAT